MASICILLTGSIALAVDIKSTEESSAVCYMEGPGGEIIHLDHLCGVSEEEMSDSNEPEEIRIEGTRSGPYTVGDTMSNGVTILSDSGDVVEYLYPTGVKLVRNRRDGTTRYISQNGEEIKPGDSVELYENESFQIPEFDSNDSEDIESNSVEFRDIDDEGFIHLD
ncbi:hypothetical protein Lepto7375DRAFT_2077 [Leptolyngbya sp. PCC 7375]|nr:hypothetical protein Lepto7375DRAFT_2077 [Leptolyngbya sp. PCC 7375]